MSSYNKIITTVNSITQDYSVLPNQNECIVIDSSNNRIGINTLNPEYEIDICNGTLKTEHLKISGTADISNIEVIHFNNFKFIYKDPNENTIWIDTSGETIKFKSGVVFNERPSFPVASVDGTIQEYAPSNIIFGGGNIYGTVIGMNNATGVIDASDAYFKKIYAFDLFLNNKLDVSGIEVSNNIFIDDSLQVNKNAIINNKLDVSNIEVSNNVLIKGSLDVCTNIIINNNAKIYNQLDVSNIEISNNLTVTNNATINNKLDASSIEVYNDVEIHGDLKVEGTNRFIRGDGSKLKNVGEYALTQYKDASLNNVDISGSLIVSNNSNFYSDLKVYNTENSLQPIIFQIQLNKNKTTFQTAVQFHQSVNCDASFNITNYDTVLSAYKINVIDNTTINNKLDVSRVEISNNLIVDGYSLFYNKLDISSISVSNDLIVKKNTIIENELDVSYLEISNNLLVENNATINHKLDVSRVEISNNLIVAGYSLFYNKLDISSISVSNDLIVNNDLSINQRADISYLVVLNDISFNNKIYGDGSELTNVGADALTKGYDSSFTSVSISGDLTISNSDKKLTVLSESIFNNNIDMCNNNIENIEKITSKNIDISNDSSFNSSLFIKNDLSINGNINIGGIATFNTQNLNNLTINNLIDVSTINVSNDLIVRGKSNFNNLSTFYHKLDATAITISNGLIVRQNATIENRLDVEQDVSLNSNVEISNNLTVNNLLDVSGIIVNNKLNTDILEVSNIIITNKFTHNNIYSFRLNGTTGDTYFTLDSLNNLMPITLFFNSYDSSFNYKTNNVIMPNETDQEFKIPYTGIYNINLLINWIIRFNLIQGRERADFEFYISLGVKRSANVTTDITSNTLYKVFFLDRITGLLWNSKTTQNFSQTIYLEEDDKLIIYCKATNYTTQNNYSIGIDFNNSYFNTTLINLMTKT